MFRFNNGITRNVSRRWLRRRLQNQQQCHLMGRAAQYQSSSVLSAQYSSSPYLSEPKDDNEDTEETQKIIQAEWIPPNRPLHGDQDHSQLFKTQKDLDRAEDALLFTVEEDESEEETLRRLEKALELEEKLEVERQKEYADAEQDFDNTNIDWLQTRRQALGTQHPEQDQVPIKTHELLTEEEVTTLLTVFGGQDILVLKDDEEYPRMGGANGMVLCTAESQFLVRSITKNLVDHLKERELQDLGVAGAKMGKHFLQTTAGRESDWNVIDCRTYIVHIFDAKTRKALKLEELWSGKDPLWKLNTNDEDTLDDYVADHYVPYSYGPNTVGTYGEASISKLQRQQWLSPHRPVISTEQKLRDRRAQKRLRRERKRQEAKEAYY
ncbi:unnamed protein product [Cylindrotheca closterium]|uniref:Ribosomal silencing factor RsfS n=1 Tax=Cylindrotheca closterium TaxID=2856 RepID=A0AAD2GAP0_9STRA|nr:unnamed protein product [Cylindrotheca closterium]